jgi:hypothetical protein
MSVNPDIAAWRASSRDARLPAIGELRFVERVVIEDGAAIVPTRRILQQYQWSSEDGDHRWYDVPLETE